MRNQRVCCRSTKSVGAVSIVTELFPIPLDDAVRETGEAWAADIRRMRHIGDFRDWKNHDSYKKAFDRLVRDLKAKGERAAKA